MRPVARQAAGLALAGGVVLAASAVLSPGAVLAASGRLVGRPASFALALCAFYLLRPLVAWPITPVSVLVGYVYGPVAGFPVALAGAVGTAMPPFLLARHASTDAGPLGRFGRAGGRAFGATGETRGVLAARLAPLPTDAVSYAAGLSGVSAGPVVVGTLLGEAPWTLAAVLVGGSLETLSTGSLDAAEPALVVGLSGLAVLVLAGPACRRLFDWPGAPVGD